MRKLTKLQKVFRAYNRKYFAGKLPECRVIWGKLEAPYIGTYDPNIPLITLSPTIRKWNCFWRLTLLHEMTHHRLRNHPEEVKARMNAKHGPRFNQEMRRLARAEAFDGLW